MNDTILLEQILLSLIAIHNEQVMRNAYDLRVLSEESYEAYLREQLRICREVNINDL